MTIPKVVVACVFALTMAACGTPKPGGSDIVAQVTAQARALCKFVPTAETILALVATGQPELAAAAGIANAICKAVAPTAGQQKAPGTVAVAGVPIRGHFEQ